MKVTSVENDLWNMTVQLQSVCCQWIWILVMLAIQLVQCTVHLNQVMLLLSADVEMVMSLCWSRTSPMLSLHYSMISNIMYAEKTLCIIISWLRSLGYWLPWCNNLNGKDC